MAKLPVVRDQMDKHVATLPPETRILDAVGFLLEKRVTGAPVVDKAGRLIGILTEKDCLRLIAEGVGGDLPRGTVADYMTPDPETIPPDLDVYFGRAFSSHATSGDFWWSRTASWSAPSPASTSCGRFGQT